MCSCIHISLLYCSPGIHMVSQYSGFLYISLLHSLDDAVIIVAKQTIPKLNVVKQLFTWARLSWVIFLLILPVVTCVSAISWHTEWGLPAPWSADLPALCGPYNQVIGFHTWQLRAPKHKRSHCQAFLCLRFVTRTLVPYSLGEGRS